MAIIPNGTGAYVSSVSVISGDRGIYRHAPPARGTYSFPMAATDSAGTAEGGLRVSFEGGRTDPNGEAVDAEDVVLAAGDSFTFTPTHNHSFQAEGSVLAKVLWVLNPALPEGPRASSS